MKASSKTNIKPGYLRSFILSCSLFAVYSLALSSQSLSSMLFRESDFKLKRTPIEKLMDEFKWNVDGYLPLYNNPSSNDSEVDKNTKSRFRFFMNRPKITNCTRTKEDIGDSNKEGNFSYVKESPKNLRPRCNDVIEHADDMTQHLDQGAQDSSPRLVQRNEARENSRE